MRTYLLVWNPNRWHWDEQEVLLAIENIGNGKTVADRWSCGRTKNIQVGDRVFLIRLGEEPKGIFGSGIVSAAPFVAPHWDSERANNGEYAHFIEFRYDCLANPINDIVLPRSFLKNDPRFSSMHWDSQMSGIQIPNNIAKELEKVWSELINVSRFNLPEELSVEESYPEGAKFKIIVNAYERNPKARKKCIEHFGISCMICGFDFEKAYGAVGKNVIHVHHIKPLAEIGESYEVDPVQDLCPVCPNCHAIIHSRKPAYTIEEVRGFLKRIS